MQRAMSRLSLSLLSAAALACAAGLGIVLSGGGGTATAQPGQAAAAALVPLPAQPAGVPWPGETWPEGAVPAPARETVAKALDAAFATTSGPMGETRAVVVVHRGRIVAERYGAGFDAESKLVSWSVAKSVTAALVGVGAREGLLKLDDPIRHARWADDDPRAAITFRQALQMSDGLKWREEGYDDPVANDAAKMLFGPGRENIAAYVAGKPLEHDPGTRWRYSSGTTNLISAALARRIGADPLRDPTGKEALRGFMYDKFFRVIGMDSTAAEFDIAGNFYGSSLVHATARDWARFGLLHLRDGVWDGERVLPEGWVDFLRTPASSEGAVAYGAHWWLSRENRQGLLKEGPFDSFEAHGFQGQLIVVIPSKDLVVVRLGLMSSENGWDALGAWLQPVVSAFPTVN